MNFQRRLRRILLAVFLSMPIISAIAREDPEVSFENAPNLKQAFEQYHQSLAGKSPINWTQVLKRQTNEEDIEALTLPYQASVIPALKRGIQKRELIEVDATMIQLNTSLDVYRTAMDLTALLLLDAKRHLISYEPERALSSIACALEFSDLMGAHHLASSIETKCIIRQMSGQLLWSMIQDASDTLILKSVISLFKLTKPDFSLDEIYRQETRMIVEHAVPTLVETGRKRLKNNLRREKILMNLASKSYGNALAHTVNSIHSRIFSVIQSRDSYPAKKKKLDSMRELLSGLASETLEEAYGKTGTEPFVLDITLQHLTQTYENAIRIYQNSLVSQSLDDMIKLSAFIRIYAIREGTLPSTYEQLRKIGLTDTPLDPFTGETYRFFRMEGPTLLLYSPGPDLKDQNADIPYFLKDATGDLYLTEFRD